MADFLRTEQNGLKAAPHPNYQSSDIKDAPADVKDALPAPAGRADPESILRVAIHVDKKGPGVKFPIIKADVAWATSFSDLQVRTFYFDHKAAPFDIKHYQNYWLDRTEELGIIEKNGVDPKTGWTALVGLIEGFERTHARIEFLSSDCSIEEVDHTLFVELGRDPIRFSAKGSERDVIIPSEQLEGMPEDARRQILIRANAVADYEIAGQAMYLIALYLTIRQAKSEIDRRIKGLDLSNLWPAKKAEAKRKRALYFDRCENCNVELKGGHYSCACRLVAYCSSKCVQEDYKYHGVPCQYLRCLTDGYDLLMPCSIKISDELKARFAELEKALSDKTYRDGDGKFDALVRFGGDWAKCYGPDGTDPTDSAVILVGDVGDDADVAAVVGQPGSLWDKIVLYVAQAAAARHPPGEELWRICRLLKRAITARAL